MKLPNAEQAVLNISKIRDYCLSEQHPRGKHKARTFKVELGLTSEDAAELKEKLLAVVRTAEATETHQDQYGIRYTIDFLMTKENKKAALRTVWIVRTGEIFPRFVTCYVLKK